MLGLQVSIGALNDAADVALDAMGKPSKPIPSGLATRRDAVALAVGGFIAALALSAVSGPAVAGIALACLALGYAYDLRLSRTVWSWLPLSLALPLSPIHAWLGATGTVPAGLVGLVPVAAIAGLMLSLSNGLVDLERDRSSGKAGLALRLGQGRAWLANAVAVALLLVLVVLLIPAIPAGGLPRGADGNGGALWVLQRLGFVAGAGLLGFGVLLLRSRSAHVRERGWEAQAVGVAAVGVAWLAGVAAGVAAGA